jgi:hypothetical protein
MARFLKTLKGHESLGTVFWGYCIVGSFVIGALLFVVYRVTMRWDSSPHHAIANWGTGALFITYFLWAHISLWTCAFNVKRRGWGYVARCYAVAVVIYYFVGISGNFGSGPPGIRQVLLPSSQSEIGNIRP